jgi:hypothetical protein
VAPARGGAELAWFVLVWPWLPLKGPGLGSRYTSRGTVAERLRMSHG